MKYEKSIFIGDIHTPFQDDVCMNIVFKFMKWFKPNYIFLLGDIIDFYGLSHFDKDPQRITSLQDDLDTTITYLYKLRQENPKAKIVYFEGNHELRLQKYLWQHPEISKLKVMQLENLLQLDKLKIEFIPQNKNYDYHNFQIEHGEIIRKHSGYTARGQMEKRGISGISGHSHRLGTHYLSNMGGDYIWLENGCLCSREPEYIKNPNWQNGWSVGYFKENDNRFVMEQICITKNKAVYAGEEFNGLNYGKTQRRY